MAYDNAAVVRRFLNEVWTQGNIDIVDELIDSGCVTYDPIVGEMRGPEPIKSQVREYRSAFPDLFFTIDDLVVSGDKVYTRYTATGTHKGPIMGVPPSGRTWSTRGMSFARISNGKVVEGHQQWDTFNFLLNLGVLPQIEKGTAPSPQPQSEKH
jgi:steroid delta-isomerase-like uncharacterized protein